MQNIASHSAISPNRRAADDLSGIAWAKPLLDRVYSLGGTDNSPESFGFELRFAAEIHRSGSNATYEFKTGVGASSVDFCIHSTAEWLVELASPQPHAFADEESQMKKFAGVLGRL